jgi:hypothetical protein
MFSVSSPTPLSPDARAALETALTRVAEDCFYAQVEPPEPDWREKWSAQADWVQARVDFSGAGSGAVVCRLPRSLARDLSVAFLGMSDDDLAGPIVINDLTGELANMVCGCWLTRAFPSKLFELKQPAIGFASEPPPGDWVISYLNGAPLGVALALKAA